jgi:hypothetical protein
MLAVIAQVSTGSKVDRRRRGQGESNVVTGKETGASRIG